MAGEERTRRTNERDRTRERDGERRPSGAVGGGRACECGFASHARLSVTRTIAFREHIRLTGHEEVRR